MVMAKSIKIIAITVLIFILAGCKSNPVQSVVEVFKPVPVQCPEPAEVVKPTLPIYELTEADRYNYARIAKTYYQSIKILEIYAESLEEALKAYKHDGN